MIFNIKDFGAVADGKTMNTKAIQKAIDTCFENGGGQVFIEGGRICLERSFSVQT